MPRLFVQVAKPADKDVRDGDLWLAMRTSDWKKILPVVVAKLKELTGE